jgi:Ca2+-transporting ATPase
MPAIESLGATTVLCVDKTGTLTENRMRVAAIATARSTVDLRDRETPSLGSPERSLLATAAAASEIDPFDPMEKAIRHAAEQWAASATSRYGAMRLAREYDYSPGLPAVTHVWQADGNAAFVVAVKGSPEAVAALCRLDPATRERLLGQVSALARDGLRVLAVAEGRFEGTDFPASPHGFELELLGLVGLADPVRESVPGAIAECRAAGIRVLMITGDHPETARAIGRAVGLDLANGVVTGREIAALDDEALRNRVRDVDVFARVLPEQKLLLVRALKANGEVVAMTGDGVNDAPALKAAHIGVAMGRRGTDVAREAASLVLLDDDFASLVATVRQGRRIYDNIRNAMIYLLAVHIPLAGMGLLPVLAGWPLFLFPVHVVFLEFVIDPACSLVFEAERAEADLMRRPPRDPREPLFSRAMLAEAIVLGLAALVAVAAVYAIALAYVGEGRARSLAFVTLVTANLLLILANRSRRESMVAIVLRPNRTFWWIALSAFAALAAAVYVPGAANLFRFEPPSLAESAGAIGAAILAVGWVEIARRWHRRRPRR